MCSRSGCRSRSESLQDAVLQPHCMPPFTTRRNQLVTQAQLQAAPRALQKQGNATEIPAPHQHMLPSQPQGALKSAARHQQAHRWAVQGMQPHMPPPQSAQDGHSIHRRMHRNRSSVVPSLHWTVIDLDACVMRTNDCHHGLDHHLESDSNRGRRNPTRNRHLRWSVLKTLCRLTRRRVITCRYSRRRQAADERARAPQ